MSREGDGGGPGWTLEGVLPDGRTWVIPVDPVPFRIGRQRDCNLVLNSPSVSRMHAELDLEGGELTVLDGGSTNGTFLNGAPLVGRTPLRSGDLLHFGQVEFRVSVARGSESPTDTFMAMRGDEALPAHLPRKEGEFLELLRGRAVQILYQPIVDLATGLPDAYEAVGRGAHADLPQAPTELFRVAESLGLAADLSRLLRAAAIRECALLPAPPHLFLNLHPAETSLPGLLHSLEELRGEFPAVPFTLEVSEQALVEPGRMRQLKAELGSLGIGLAYDDFGAGQARILELIQAPPDVLKFDMALVRGLHEAPPATRKMLRSLVAMAAEIGVRSLAEGIESEGERLACLDVGFALGQGFLLGSPGPYPPPAEDPTPTPRL